MTKVVTIYFGVCVAWGGFCYSMLALADSVLAPR